MADPWNTVDVAIDGNIAILVLDRPELGNPIDAKLRIELQRLWRALDADPDVRVALVRARGHAFSVGFPAPEPDDPNAQDPPAPFGPKSCGFTRPVVVELRGDVGAGAFALIGDADHVLATSDMQFFVPLNGGPFAACDTLALTSRLPRVEANRLALMGTIEPMPAERARQLGLIDEIVPPDELSARALACARALAD